MAHAADHPLSTKYRLVDSVDLHAHAWVDAFRDFGHQVDFKQMRAQIGKGGMS
jgi:beta-phosphoglucomutase-like phosphatase (HAD superfamily)